MVSKNLFNTHTNRDAAVADAVNNAGGTAYSTTAEHALAQFAVTGCLGNTFYVDAEAQLKTVLELAAQCSPEYVAKVAKYARQMGYMKDMPAVLAATLAVRDVALLKKVFPAVINDFKMLRNFVQVIRSGAVGRKSFGTAVKRLLQNFFDGKTDNEIFRGSIGNDPSLPDVIKMVHPKPSTKARSNLFAYLLGKPFVVDLLPEEAKAFELFKNNPSGAPPGINFQFLSNIKMSTDQWAALSESMTWHTLRMNLNTLARNGVFSVAGRDVAIASKLADRKAIVGSKVFPYQLLAAYLNVTDVPVKVKNALQDAMEIATENVPVLPGKIVVAVDTSGSMGSPITGYRAGATTTMRCVDVAGLMASAVLRKNEDTLILPFETSVRSVTLNSRDSVVTNATKLAGFGGGGTDCASAIRHLNDTGTKADAIIFVSDNESWFNGTSYYGKGTAMQSEWHLFLRRNPKAKLVCIDITPGSTTQTQDAKNVLNVGGFNDRVFDIVNLFLRGELDGTKWAELINNLPL